MSRSRNVADLVGSGGFIEPKQLAFHVTALNTSQSISATTITKVEWGTTELDTASYWDATNHRYTPQVAGWYKFSAGIRAQLAGINEYVRIYIRKNGSGPFYVQIQTDLDSLAGGNYPGPTVMFQMNGTTDYAEVWFYTDEATTIHDSAGAADASWFNGVLIHAT